MFLLFALTSSFMLEIPTEIKFILISDLRISQTNWTKFYGD